MDSKFKLSMFITSFLPLWLLIFVIDIWNICSTLPTFSLKEINCYRVIKFVNLYKIELVTIVALTLAVALSIVNINSFIKQETENKGKQNCTIKNARRANRLTTEFLLAYIFPLVAFDFSALRDVVLFLLFLIILAFLAIRNNNIYTNIFFELKKYHMYECDLTGKKMDIEYEYSDCLVISKSDLTAKSTHSFDCYDFDNYIYINLEKSEGDK